MSASIQQLQIRFQQILPRIEVHARIVFRNVRCTIHKDDCIAECVALCWQWFLRLARKGKDASRFAGTLASFAARAVRSGRRLCGQHKANDVMSPSAQRRLGFNIASLPSKCNSLHFTQTTGQQMQDALEERLQDNHTTPIPDQVAFRMDWPRFFRSLSSRDQTMVEFLALGHNATRASEQFHLSPGRITQLRQRWGKDWQQYQESDQST